MNSKNKQIGPKNKLKNPQIEKVIQYFVLVLFILSVLMLLNKSYWKECTIPQYEGTRGFVENNWTFKQGETVLQKDLKLPAFKHLKTGEKYYITTNLDYDGSKDKIPTCFYFVDHMHSKVYYEGKQIFTYTPEDINKPDKSKSPGNVYVAVKLPQNCQGKELTIEFIPSLNESIEYQLPNPIFGNFYTEARHTFWEELGHNITAIISVFLGISTILFGTLAFRGSKYRECLFIGIFASLFGLYNFTESNFDFYVISNPYYTYILDYITFTLIPIFLMAFLWERMKGKPRKVISVMIGVGVILFLTEVVLHFNGFYDMREFLLILHIEYFVDFIIILIMLFGSKKNRWKKSLILQLLPILIGALLDAAVYYLHWDFDTSDSTFSACGVIIFIIAELIHAWKASIEVYAESAKIQDYQQMAYVDALTGIGNRRAYTNEIESINSQKETYSSVIVVSSDINNLKEINDTFGHAAGDFIIRNAANILTDLSENYGNAFRVGGDEFIVLAYDMEMDEFENRLKNLYSQIDEINVLSTAKLSLAIGYEINDGQSIESTVEIADKKMYDNKAAYKALKNKATVQ